MQRVGACNATWLGCVPGILTNGSSTTGTLAQAYAIAPPARIKARANINPIDSFRFLVIISFLLTIYPFNSNSIQYQYSEFED
jgi:hypothetical protein